jgi:hypothetical protein
MMIKRSVLGVGLCFALCVAFLTGSEINRACAADVIKLGFIGSNTDLAADLGAPSSDAAKLFVKELQFKASGLQRLFKGESC